MHSRDVVFYDQKANIKTSRKAIIERKEAWKANMGETKALLKALRGIKNVDIDDMY